MKQDTKSVDLVAEVVAKTLKRFQAKLIMLTRCLRPTVQHFSDSEDDTQCVGNLHLKPRSEPSTYLDYLDLLFGYIWIILIDFIF